MSAEQAFLSGASQEYGQQPPRCAVDHWFYRLGLSLRTTPAETPSNFFTLPSVLPVFDYIDLYVSHISHTTPCTIDSKGVRILYRWVLLIFQKASLRTSC